MVVVSTPISSMHTLLSRLMEIWGTSRYTLQICKLYVCYQIVSAFSYSQNFFAIISLAFAHCLCFLCNMFPVGW